LFARGDGDGLEALVSEERVQKASLADIIIYNQDAWNVHGP